MANVRRLSVSLTAKTEKFVKGFKRARREVRRFKRSIPGLNLALSKVGAVAAGVGVGGLAALVKGQMSAIDSTTKMADRIGISVEALVGLRHAADLTGVSATTLDMSLQRMTRRVAEAAQGTGEARGALQELGLSAKAMHALSPDEQFRRFADAMKGVSAQGDRVRIAMRLFDTEGVALVNTLKDGADALRVMEAEAKKMGLTITRLDAAQVEAANDSLTRVKALLTGALRRATVELAPYIEAIAKKLLKAGLSGEGLGAKVVRAVKSMVANLGNVIRVLGTVGATFGMAFGGAAVVVSGVVAAVVELFNALTIVLRLIPGYGKKMDLVRKAASDLLKTSGRIAAKSVDMFGAVDRAADGVESAFSKIGDSAQKIPERLREVHAAISEMSGPAARMAKAWFKAARAAGKFNDESRKASAAGYSSPQTRAAEAAQKAADAAAKSESIWSRVMAPVRMIADHLKKAADQARLAVIEGERQDALYDEYTSAVEQVWKTQKDITGELGQHQDLYDRLIEEGQAQAADTLKAVLARNEEIRAKIEEQRDASRKLADEQRRAADLLGEYERALERMTPEYKQTSALLGEHHDLWRALVDAGKYHEANNLLMAHRREQEIVKEKKAQVDLVKKTTVETKRLADAEDRRKRAAAQTREGMKRELELLRATNDFDRERIRIKHELKDAQDRAGKDLVAQWLAMEIAGEKLSDLERRKLESMKKQTKEAEKTAAATERTVQAVRKSTRHLDITKKFERIGGNAQGFGFGAGTLGQGIGSLFTPVIKKKPRIPKLKVFGGTGSGAGASANSAVSSAAANVPEPPKVADLSPAVQRAIDAWAKIQPIWERLGQLLDKLGKDITATVQGMSASVTAWAETTSRQIADLNAEVRAMKDRLAAASELGVAGG